MLTLSFSLTPTVASAEQVLVADTTVGWGLSGNPARESIALVIGAEMLSPWQASQENKQEPVVSAYNPIDFKSLDGTPVLITRPQDGVLRVFLAAVPVVAISNVLALPVNTGYALADGEVFVRGLGATRQEDELLTSEMLLGQGDSVMLPDVLAYTVRYHLWDMGLADSLAKLNLRYLQLPFQQQQPVQELHERITLFADGAKRLYRDNRLLDCVAVLQGAQRLLVTQGETPDDYSPLLTGGL